MKSHPLASYARIALVAAAALAVTACAHVQDSYEPDRYYSPQVTYYDYWYYPAVGAYYDTHAHTYIYFEQDHWIRARVLPSRFRPYLGRYVNIRSRNDRPYEEHDRHRQQYAPERYKRSKPGARGNDVWLGAPRKEIPQHDRDERRYQPGERDGERGSDRGPGPVPQDYRERSPEYSRQQPNRRYQIAPGHRLVPAGVAPDRPMETGDRDRTGKALGREQGNGRDAAPVQKRYPAPSRAYPPLTPATRYQMAPGQRVVPARAVPDKRIETEDQHSPGRALGRERVNERGFTTVQKQYPAPGQGYPRQAPATRYQVAPGQHPTPASTAPAKREDKGPEHPIRRDESQDRYRDGGDRRGYDRNQDDDRRPWNRQGSPDNRYEHAR